ncbi:2-oxoglutarate ferredoxin oxidoreductase, gamma subunit [Proteiniborus ethanoligenes]|uniref:2-oxoglutarate ferredoxin oxidoreductase, gamma subunit n=1 Tax=Proteiniborus ethanoligenes TaxID=415015 RepID=A0A1H3NBD9_9FIRM|nr:2-oxoacid:acceptor oxidoreductase family protein [Proteiniborus ethanoligenes]TAH61724.1 MAG: 2-oxoacid:ferredoxin oxidoreductase subunit gamma [Gottschalkiaceae bacterium]SDY86073.1 2-oxoglutarate ferredoxin oxidoreductase, gamma subunit [Proteiniborus ethanoligenes]
MSNQYEIRLSGSGGQGLILAGIILAEAAIEDGKNSVQSQSYGPEARGGASRSEVIISNNEIYYPKVNECDLMLALTQLACDKYVDTLKKGGTLVIDDTINPPHRNDIDIISIPIVGTANEKLNKPMVANIIALGAINCISGIVSKESLKNAVLSKVPRGTELLNEKALEEGMKLINGCKE